MKKWNRNTGVLGFRGEGIEMATKKDGSIEKYANKLYNSELPMLKEKLKREEEDIIDAAIRWLTTEDGNDSNKKGRRVSPHPLRAKWWSISTNGCVQSVKKIRQRPRRLPNSSR